MHVMWILAAVLVWAIREQRLISSEAEDMEFNIKLDGRPLGGVFKKFCQRIVQWD